MKHLLVALFLIGCTDDTRTVRVLEQAGFEDIQITGYEPFSCSESDQFRTGFRAKGPTGKNSTGTVCCGLLKSCTIRID